MRTVEVIRDAIHHEQLVRIARLKADASDNADLVRRLREAGIEPVRKAWKIWRTSGERQHCCR